MFENYVGISHRHVKPKFYRNFISADYNAITNTLSSVNWDAVLADDSIDNIISKFNVIVQNIIEAHTPVFKQHVSTYLKWYDSEIVNAIRDRKRASCLWKSFHDLHDYIEFKRLNIATSSAQLNRISSVIFDPFGPL